MLMEPHAHGTSAVPTGGIASWQAIGGEQAVWLRNYGINTGYHLSKG